MPIKVSIITVTYNSEKFLEDCILSVYTQDYPHIEHIVVDGWSTDNTIDIITRNSDKLAHWLIERDKGMYEAINKGLALATGDVVGILNSDDMFSSKDVVSEIARCFEEEDIDSLYGDLQFVDQNNTDKIYRVWKSNAYRRSRFHYGWMPAHPTFYIRRKWVEQYGGYETHFYSAADYEFMARYLYTHQLSSRHVPKMFVKMRIGGASNGNLFQRLRANRRDYLAMKKNKIPYAFFVSILKPITKLHQYKAKLENFRIFQYLGF